MKLLFDHNLSPKLVAQLADLFPDCSHVETEGLAQADDEEVWDYARSHGFSIVTKDADYLSVVQGSPPKVIWLLLGNCATSAVEAVLRNRHPDIEAFSQDPAVGTLALS